jgi:hypothetical protein
MSNGGIIGPVVNPTRGDLTTAITASGTYTNPGFGPGGATVMIVAGGGGGAAARSIFVRNNGSGGAGAGGLILTPSSYPIGLSPAPVTVGGGGTGGSTCVATGSSGTDSIAFSLTAKGGGSGSYGSTPATPGTAGGSGGASGGDIGGKRTN